VEQHKRLPSSLMKRQRGDDEAHRWTRIRARLWPMDCLQLGGEGIGIDRLVMLLTGSKSIRDVRILFPL